MKYCIIEDAFNDAWTRHIVFGRRLTFDESRIAGWFHSAITIGPEPKPIRTGAKIHSMCITDGPLATFMIRVRTYGGKSDETLKKKTQSTGSVQVFINLLDEFLTVFKGRGCHVTMDSTYMGELLALVARQVWKVNVVGSTQTNRCGPDHALVAAAKKAMTVLR